LSAILRYSPILSLNPSGSDSQGTWCRYTRMEFKPLMLHSLIHGQWFRDQMIRHSRSQSG
jgi:hypothetical protein